MNKIYEGLADQPNEEIITELGLCINKMKTKVMALDCTKN